MNKIVIKYIGNMVNGNKIRNNWLIASICSNRYPVHDVSYRQQGYWYSYSWKVCYMSLSAIFIIFFKSQSTSNLQCRCCVILQRIVNVKGLNCVFVPVWTNVNDSRLSSLYPHWQTRMRQIFSGFLRLLGSFFELLVYCNSTNVYSTV